MQCPNGFKVVIIRQKLNLGIEKSVMAKLGRLELCFCTTPYQTLVVTVHPVTVHPNGTFVLQSVLSTTTNMCHRYDTAPHMSNPILSVLHQLALVPALAVHASQP